MTHRGVLGRFGRLDVRRLLGRNQGRVGLLRTCKTGRWWACRTRQVQGQSHRRWRGRRAVRWAIGHRCHLWRLRFRPRDLCRRRGPFGLETNLEWRRFQRPIRFCTTRRSGGFCQESRPHRTWVGMAWFGHRAWRRLINGPHSNRQRHLICAGLALCAHGQRQTDLVWFWPWGWPIRGGCLQPTRTSWAGARRLASRYPIGSTVRTRFHPGTVPPSLAATKPV